MVRHLPGDRRGGAVGGGVLLRGPRSEQGPRLRRHLTGDDAGHRRGSRGRRPTAGTRPGARESWAGRSVPDRVRRLGHHLHRHELHVLAPGPQHQPVESGPPQPASTRPGDNYRAVAAPAAQPARRHLRASRDHDDPAWLRLLPLSALRAGSGPCPCCPHPAARDVRTVPVRRGHAHVGQPRSRPARPVPVGPGGGPGSLFRGGLDHPGPGAAGRGHRQRGLSPAGRAAHGDRAGPVAATGRRTDAARLWRLPSWRPSP